MPSLSFSGTLAFGQVAIGSVAHASFTISSTGTGPPTVTSINGPAGLTASWTSGTIAAGQSQTVTLTFAPTVAQSYSGTITVVSNAQVSTNTLPMTAYGVPVQLFTMSGTGNNVFTVPSSVLKLHITGTYTGSLSNFIVNVLPSNPSQFEDFLVNALIGASTFASGQTSDGVYLIDNGGGNCQITNSDGVTWSMTEVRGG